MQRPSSDLNENLTWKDLYEQAIRMRYTYTLVKIFSPSITAHPPKYSRNSSVLINESTNNLAAGRYEVLLSELMYI